MIIRRKILGLNVSGFTMIELLIVIAIIGVLAATSVVLINPEQQLKKARDTKRKADIQQIRAALELYRSDNGVYPTTDWINSSQDASIWFPSLVPNYVKTALTDPKNTGDSRFTDGYSYLYQSINRCGINGGISYILSTKLENTGDPETNNNIQYGSCSWPAVDGYSGLYTVTSP